jgi:hypothetical protein
LILRVHYFILIILCIFTFSFLLFRIYGIEKTKKTKTKKEKTKKHLPPFEALVGCKKPQFQLAVAAILPPLLQTYRLLLRRQVLTVISNGGRFLPPFQMAAGTQPMLNPTFFL